MDSTDQYRAAYAETLCCNASVQSAALARAFATVPREHFLGPGPWTVLRPGPAGLRREVTSSAEPYHVYQDVPVVIDGARLLNNGQPSVMASWLDALDLSLGDRAVHVGCGPGYYTAIVAEAVGPSGRVIGVEMDAELAARARAALAPWPQARVLQDDGAASDLPVSDAIFVNAGVTHPQARWLDCLAPGGRLVLPCTVEAGEWRQRFPRTPGVGWGRILKLIRTENEYDASFLSECFIFHCIGARDLMVESRLREAFGRGTWHRVRSLRRDPHSATNTCWLHGDAFCLSTLEAQPQPFMM